MLSEPTTIENVSTKNAMASTLFGINSVAWMLYIQFTTTEKKTSPLSQICLVDGFWSNHHKYPTAQGIISQPYSACQNGILNRIPAATGLSKHLALAINAVDLECAIVQCKAQLTFIVYGKTSAVCKVTILFRTRRIS